MGHSFANPNAGRVPYEFDQDSAVEAAGPGRWRGTVSDGWSIAGAPNGGYVASIGLQALRRTLPHPDPLSVAAHFLSKAEPGPVEIDTEVLRVGNSLSTGEARIRQSGEIRVVVTSMHGDLEPGDGPTHITGSPPDLPPPEACIRAEAGPGLPTILGRYDLRLTPESSGWAIGAPSGVAEMGGWNRFADGREPDAWSLPLFADSFPPTAANVEAIRWVPTLAFTVQVRGRPSPGWLGCGFRTRFLIDGYLEEDGEIWDSDGRLVALSRQFARIHR